MEACVRFITLAAAACLLAHPASAQTQMQNQGLSRPSATPRLPAARPAPAPAPPAQADLPQAAGSPPAKPAQKVPPKVAPPPDSPHR